MTAPGVEAVLAEVLAAERCKDVHPERWRGGWSVRDACYSCRSWSAHVAAEQVKALAEWAQQDDGIAAAMDGVYEVEGRLPDPSVRQYAVAVLTAIFGGAS